MTKRRLSLPKLSAVLALLTLFALSTGWVLWAQTPQDTDPPVIRIVESGTDLTDGRLFNRAATPVLQVTDASAVTVNATLDGAAFTSGTAVSGEGTHLLSVTATDAAGNSASLAVGFEIDTTPPAFVSVSPENDAVTASAQVTLEGRVTGASAVTVDGQAAALTGQDFTAGPYSLSEGARSWTIVARDAAGNTAQRTHRITRDSQAPTVAISQPAAGTVLKDASVDVVGSAQDARLASVTVNGTAATLTGTTWVARQVPLAEGSNSLVARAEDRAGNAAETTRAVVRDSQGPDLAITDPAPGTVVPGASITLRGTASDPHLDRVEVNGVRASLTGTSWSIAMNLVDGANDFTVRAYDKVNNATEAAVSVTRDSDAPAVRITQPADGARLSAQTVTVSGTVDDEPGLTVTVNGVTATVTNGTFSAPGISLVEGENTLTARAKDSVGNQGTHTRILIRDTIAPRLVSADPASGALALPVDTVFRLTFSEDLADLPTGSLRLETGAGQSIGSSYSRVGNVVTVRSLDPLPSSTQIRLVLTANLKDLAGNALATPPTLTFFTVDTTAPAAPVFSPAPAARICAPSLTLAGTAEAGAVLRVEGGAAAAEGRADETGHFSLTVQLTPSGLNRLRVTATDGGGNDSPAAVAEVVHDCQAPRVVSAERQGENFAVTFSEPVQASSLAGAVLLTAPSGAVAGATTLSANGLTATFDPTGTLPSGALRLEVTAAVRDLAGNAMAFPWSQVFGAQGGSGFLLGTVIDDATGRPLAGARVLVYATNGTPLPEPLPEQVTGDDGRFRLPVPAGTHDLTIVRPGYTPSFRIVTTGAGQGTDVFDPRLTPAAKPMALSTGTYGSGADPILTLPSGALASPVSVAVTRLAEQGLPALLPYGWSPRGAVWLELGGAALGAESTLSLPVDAPNGSTLTLVHLDLASLQWRVLGTDQVSAGRVEVTLPVAAAGLTDGGYAALEADTGALAPPAPVAGAVLGASARPAGDEPTAATLTFNPQVVLPSQSSLATAVYTLSEPAASGLPLTLLIEEELTLLDNSVRRQTPYQADLILYHASDGTPRSRFLLRPSPTAQALPLKLGAEDVTLRTYGGEAVSGNVVGPEGGTVSGAEGDRIDLPAGAVTEPTAVVVTRKTAADLGGLAVPAGTALAGVVDLDLNGKRLLVPGALSLALSLAPAAGDKGLLLEVIELESGRAFRPVAALQATATGWTTVAIDSQDLAWPGVREEGLYAFVRLTSGFGYLRGTVSDVGGTALSGAVVRSPSVTWLQLSNANGTYVLPAPVGTVTATAENRATGNLGTGQAEIAAADARVDLNLSLQAVGPRVLQVTPADGAVDVLQGIQPTIRFSEPVAPASVTAGGTIQLLSEGQPLAIDLEVNGSLVQVKPRSALLPLTQHELRVTSGVQDLQGNSLESPVASHFTTLRVLLTNDVDLSRVFLVQPDANGQARVLGRPGAVPANALVFIENRSALINTPSVNAGQNGGFDVNVQAALTHTLILHVLIPGSNEIVSKLTPFRTPDLKGAYLDDEAVTFATGDGVKVVVPEGAFTGPTVVRLEPRPLTELAAPVPSGFAAVYNFNLDFGGAEAKKALQISVPKPAGAPDPVEGVYLLNRAIEALGKRYWMMHDIMRLDPSGSSLTTELPPVGTAASGAQAAAVVAAADPFAVAQAQPPVFTAKAIVRQYKYYVTGSAFPGQYQVAAAEIPLGFTVFPSFDMNFLVGIWNLGMEGMATRIDSGVAQFLEGDGILIPTRRHQTYKLVVRDLATGFRLYENTFAAPTGDELIPLPPDVYGDKVPPAPAGGTPIRFIPLNFSGPSELQVDLGIKARWADKKITVTGDVDSTQSDVQIRLIGLDDGADVTTASTATGTFTLESPGETGKRYLLAIGARIPADRSLEINFTEALSEGFGGIEVLDPTGHALSTEKVPVGSRATVRVSLGTGWRAGKTYTLRLTPDLADASGNKWDHQLDVELEIYGSDNLGTFQTPAVRDMARLGSWMFVAADAAGLLLMDASDPAHLRNVLPNDLGFQFPLADPVRSVAVDPHGRVLVAGGGNTGYGQLKIFDPLAVDVQAITEHPTDVNLRLAAFKGTTVVSDKLGGTGTQLPSGTPRRVAVLSNDKIDDWKLGDPPPGDLQVTPVTNPDNHPDEDFEVTVTGTDGTAGLPVTLQDLTRGRWHRIDAGANGHYSIKLQVQEGDRLRLIRNEDSIAYVATTGVGVEVVDVNAFYNEDHNTVQSDVVGTYSGFKENLTLCGLPVADIGTALTDLDTLFDPGNINPLVVVGLVGQRGFILLRSNPSSVGELSLLNEECTEVEGSTAISALAVLQDYSFDSGEDEEPGATEGRDYILVAHQKGGILIYDVTDREEIKLVGRIRMPGQVSQLSVDREGRRLLVAGAAAGFYIVDLKTPLNKDLIDVDRDGKDDRVLETVTLTGNTNVAVRLAPELGLAFAGGLNRGLTSVAVGHPQVDALARDPDGRFRKIHRVAPFGVPTAKETSEPDAPEIPGSFRVLASLPGLVGDEVKLDVSGGLGPAALGPTSCLLDEKPQITLHRMAGKPWESGYQLYLSNEIAVLADPRASRRYQQTPKEKEKCIRCDLDQQKVEEDAAEVLSGDFISVTFPKPLRLQLEGVYSKDRIDSSELRLPSVRWDLVPPVEQEATQNPCLVGEAPGLLGCSGEMTHSATDIAIRGRGFDFVFQRFYRSQAIGLGPFGPGWDHNYNQRLRKLPNGDVDYYDGMGRRETFTLQDDGTLKSPPGRFATLERVSSGWLMLDAQHNAKRFDEYGRLTSIADAVKDSKDTGNEMTFFYDAKSRLVRVNDTTGRDILFEYREESCGEIAKITDYDGREFLYDYDDKDRLVSFKTPAVPTVLAIGDPTSYKTDRLETVYAYDEGTGDLANTLNGQDNLTSVKDPRGQEWLKVGYEDSNGDQRKNEVASETWGGGNIQVQYDFGGHTATLTDPRGKQFSYTFSEKGHVQEVRDPAGASATFTYDDEGLVSTRTDPYGRVTSYAYDAPCANASIGERRSRGNLTRVAVTPDGRGPNGSSAPLVTCMDYEGYSNQPVQIVDPRGTVTLISRNQVGLPIAITQAAGTPDASTVQTSYNDYGQPQLSVNPNGNATQYLYNQLGYPAGMVVNPNGLGLVTRYETDKRGNVIAMVDPRGVGFTRAYNALNWLVETHRAITGAANTEGAPALNYVATFLHDANGNVVEERLPYGDGSTTTRRDYIYGPVNELLQTFAQERPDQPFLEWPKTYRFYDLNRNLTKIVEPDGQVTLFNYDDRNILSSVVRGGAEDPADPDFVAVTEQHRYDLEGNKISYTDGRGGVWTTSYDGYGRVSKTVDAVGNIATVSYDNGGNPTTTGVYQGPEHPGDDPVLMAQKLAEYDRLSRPKAITQRLWQGNALDSARDITSRFEYDAASNLKKIIDPLNRTATSEYDQAERLIATVDPVGNRVERDLDKGGNVLTTRSIEVQAGGPVTVTSHATYDALGRVSTTTDGLGNVDKFFYDARNNLRISIDPESVVTERTYDGLDRLTREVRPEGISVDYGYDKSSRLISYKDALGQETAYSYDVLNRRTKVTYPDGKKETYTYDASHNPRQVRDANGSLITQTFDAANRLTARSVAPGSGVIGPLSESYTYDALSRMTRAQSGNVITELTFDSLSRLLRERTAGREVAYQYDDASNATRIDYPSGFALRQTFDALNRPTSIGQVNGTAPGAPFDQAVSYAYRGQGLVLTKTLGNGLTGAHQFDGIRRLLDQTYQTATGQTVFRESLAWTPRSLKAAQSRGDLQGEGFRFAYDGAGRLTNAGKTFDPLPSNNAVVAAQAFTTLPDAFAYTYDKAQNLLSRTEKEDGVAKEVALPLDGSGRNRPASVGSVALAWDANGNLTSKGDLRFEYDYRNRLTRVSRANGDEVATYQYDAFNRRISKTVGSETRETTWRGWQPVEERRNGDLDQRRVFGLGLDEMVQLQVDLNGDGQADQTYAPLYDSTGNLVVMTGNNGKPVERYEYTPYGERKIFVDNTPPAVEQVRVKGNTLWVELSEEVDGGVLAAHPFTLANLANQQAIAIASVTRPVTTGSQARRRLVITTTAPVPADTQVRLTIPAAAFQDSFLNQPAADYELTFAWPQSDAVLQDSKGLQLQSAAVHGGHLEIGLSEEPNLATATAIQIDGAAATWTLSDDRYTLTSTAELPAGAHTLTIGTSLADLNGAALAAAFNQSFTIAAHGDQAIFEAPDPRESPTSTIGNLFGFKGLQVDSETELIYVRNRYYDPEMGRFITMDPKGYINGPNTLGFAMNDPFNNGDPFGLDATVVNVATGKEMVFTDGQKYYAYLMSTSKHDRTMTPDVATMAVVAAGMGDDIGYNERSNAIIQQAGLKADSITTPVLSHTAAAWTTALLTLESGGGVLASGKAGAIYSATQKTAENLLRNRPVQEGVVTATGEGAILGAGFGLLGKGAGLLAETTPGRATLNWIANSRPAQVVKGLFSDELATLNLEGWRNIIRWGNIPEAGTPLYRGIPSNHHAYAEALEGIAMPGDVNGTADVVSHNLGETMTSRLTSWTRSRTIAESRAGADGVILEWRTGTPPEGAGWRFLWSPDEFGEQEVLVEGILTGARVTRP